MAPTCATFARRRGCEFGVFGVLFVLVMRVGGGGDGALFFAVGFEVGIRSIARSRSRQRLLLVLLSAGPPKNRFAIREERDYVTQDDFMRAVRKLCDAKKLESTLNYDSAFGDGGQK